MCELFIDKLTCGYGARTILENVSFSVRGGDFFCLLGPNGAGKTTLFKTLLRLIKPKGGRILLNGEDVAGWSYRRFAARIGYVPQAHVPPFPYTVLDVVAMGRTSRLGLLGSPSRSDLAIAEEALQLMSISHLKDAACTEISGGERQLALIARALAQQPDILVMDEPTSNLDFGNQIAVLGLVAQLAEEKAIGIVMTTHDPNHALLYASEVAAIGRGGTFEVGAPEHVVGEAYLHDTYGVAPQTAMTRLDDGRMAKVFLPVVKRQARARLSPWKGMLVALLLGLAFSPRRAATKREPVTVRRGAASSI
jgi:iron complex transport system ATP-binding protein